MLFVQRLVASTIMGILFVAGFFTIAHADSTANLIKKLSSQNVMERRNAARELGKIKDIESVNPLIEALKDKEPMVRLDASGALIDIGQPAVEPLIKAIQHEKDTSFLWNAIRILDSIGNPKAIEPLHQIESSHPDPTIAQAARSAAERLQKASGSQ
jgi:HEAT repeat protein